MKRLGKKLSGILLAASIAATTVFPMQGTAAEEIDRGVKSGTQKEEMSGMEEKLSGTVSANVLPEAETGDNLIMPMSYDVNQPVIESFEFEENGKTLSKNDTLHFKMSAYDLDGIIRSISVQINRKGSYNPYSITLNNSSGNLYTGTFSCSRIANYEGDYYISQIRMEDRADNYVDLPVMDGGKYLYTFTLSDNGTADLSDFQMQKNPSNADGKLRVGDTVTYTVHAESKGINLNSGVYMNLNTYNAGVSKSDGVSMSYDAATGKLTGTYTIKDMTYPSEWQLNYIRVYTGSKYLYFYPDKLEPDKDLKFTVVNDDYDREKPVIKSITIDKNGQMVKAGEKVNIKVKVEEKNPSYWLYIRFKPEKSGISDLSASLSLNSSTMEYTGSISITQDTYPVKWELSSLSVSDANGNSTSLSDLQKDGDVVGPWYFTVDPEGYLDDDDAPVIESITIDKNGQWVQPGDTVTITVKVDEENPSSTAYAEFYPQVSYVSSYSRVYLNYNKDTKEYKGRIPIASDTYPCEWMLTSLSVSDIKNNYTYLENFKPDWRNDCPWYFRVRNDDTYREDVNDVTFSVYGLVPQAYGGFAYGYLTENETVKVGRRDSLKGLGIWPAPPVEGVNMKCEWNGSDQEIDGDTELFFGNTPASSYNLNISYDKSCANVFLTYLSRDEGVKMAIVPQFVDKDTTYGEMLDSLVLPEDADTSLITGYEMDRDKASQVEDTGYVSIEVKYNDCLVAWHVKYPDENGNEVSKVVSKTYQKGTTINEALAALEEPESPNGQEFEKWVLSGIDGKEPLLHEMTNLDITAVYKGKTTAGISYTYRGEDGKLASGRKLLLLDGEGISYNDVVKAVPELLKEVKHLNGLTLSGWPGISKGTDIPRYKQVNVQAQYANCVVILKYPNNAYEYVTVDKNTFFTLPVENEKYKDVSWEGYEKGETVTITEDREFIAADVTLKDGTEEEPSGDKLTEEEIGKIIADIEQSGSGEMVHVNMKKATVVPKEVLEAIKGKEVSIVLDMGAYSWSIGGNDVVASDLKDIDLKVIVDTHEIPPTIVDSLAGGNPATQISLIHDGEFGFRADLTVNLGSQNSGSTGNLYYYDSAGKLIFIDAGEVDADGNISLSFSHASDYVVIMEKELSEDGDKDKNENGSDNENEGDNSDSNRGGGVDEVISVAKAEGIAAPAIDVKDSKDDGRPKSPKTGE